MSPTLRFATIGLCTMILVTLALQATLRAVRAGGVQRVPVPERACEGTAIAVDASYEGGPVKQHSCIKKCEEGEQYYLLYTNGKATQCGAPPNCFDEGEDNGVTCTPPVVTKAP